MRYKSRSGLTREKLLWRLSLLGKPPKEIHAVPQDLWNRTSPEGGNILKGVFEFWGESMTFTSPLFWCNPKVSGSFTAVLHGFEWLRDLEATGHPEARGVARHYILHWIKNNRKWHDIIWSPDIASQRLASWMSLFDFFGHSAPDEFLISFHKAVGQHVRYVSNLCRCHPIQHLDIQTLKGALFGALALNRPIDPFLKKFEAYLVHHMGEDKMHSSRSPMTQLMVLKDVLDIRYALKVFGVTVLPRFQSIILKMADVVRFFRHGDGGLSVFHNSVEGDALFIDHILSMARENGRDSSAKQTHVPNIGFHRLNLGKSSLIMDLCSAHHNQRLTSDRLAFEFSSGSHRLLVNGTRPIQVTSLIHQPESTSSLSGTLIFFDEAQRVIREEAPLSQIETTCWEDAEEAKKVVASAWEQKIQGHYFQHKRELQLLKKGKLLIGEESVSGIPGGKAIFRYTVHPKVKVKKGPTPGTFLLTVSAQNTWLFSSDHPKNSSLHQGYYYGSDNQEQFCGQIFIQILTGDKPRKITWQLTRQE